MRFCRARPLSDAGRPTRLQCAKPVRSGACQVPDERNAWLCSRVVPEQGRLPFLDGTNSSGGHKMLKTLMISAAVSALMVSGALAQADMSPKPPAATAPKTEAIPHDTAKFIAAQSTDHWVFSKFKGTDLPGPPHADIVHAR